MRVISREEMRIRTASGVVRCIGMSGAPVSARSTGTVPEKGPSIMQRLVIRRWFVRLALPAVFALALFRQKIIKRAELGRGAWGLLLFRFHHHILT